MIPAAEGAACLRALGRHRRRRAQGVPTLSVLVGSEAEAAEIWRAWCGSADGRTVPSLEGKLRFVEPGQTLAETVERLCRELEAADPNGSEGVAALGVSRADAEAYLREEPYSRARALFAEGVVELPSAVVRAGSDFISTCRR